MRFVVNTNTSRPHLKAISTVSSFRRIGGEECKVLSTCAASISWEASQIHERKALTPSSFFTAKSPSCKSVGEPSSMPMTLVARKCCKEMMSAFPLRRSSSNVCPQ